MTAQEIVERLAPRGIRFLIEDGRLIVEPASKLSAADRLAIREAKADLLRLLAPDPERTLPIDLGRIADAIARQPRSPFLNDLAIATIAKAALSAEAAMYGLPRPRIPSRFCIAVNFRIGSPSQSSIATIKAPTKSPHAWTGSRAKSRSCSRNERSSAVTGPAA